MGNQQAMKALKESLERNRQKGLEVFMSSTYNE